MTNSNNKINLHLLSEINDRKINFPDFASMGSGKMKSFILSNYQKPNSIGLNELKKSLSDRTDLELELWCKEVYSKIQDSLNLCVTSNPSSTICISAEVE